MFHLTWRFPAIKEIVNISEIVYRVEFPRIAMSPVFIPRNSLGRLKLGALKELIYGF